MRLRFPLSSLQTNRSHVQGPQMLQERRLPSTAPRICKTSQPSPENSGSFESSTPRNTHRRRRAATAPPKNKGKGKATAESLVSTQRETPTMDDIPIRVKPTRSQLNKERAKKQATYQRGRASGLIDPAPMMTSAPPLPSNRFELLPDDTDDAEAQVPVPLLEEETELPPLTQPKSNALTQQDFQIRE
jgi:hypothetical protein